MKASSVNAVALQRRRRRRRQAVSRKRSSLVSRRSTRVHGGESAYMAQRGAAKCAAADSPWRSRPHQVPSASRTRASLSRTAAARALSERRWEWGSERRAAKLGNYSVAALVLYSLLLSNADAAAATVIRNEEGINLRAAGLSAHWRARVNRNRSETLCGSSLTRGRNRCAWYTICLRLVFRTAIIRIKSSLEYILYIRVYKIYITSKYCYNFCTNRIWTVCYFKKI